MPGSLRLELQLNNEVEGVYINNLLKPLFQSMGFGNISDFLSTNINPQSPVLGRGSFKSLSSSEEPKDDHLFRHQKSSVDSITSVKAQSVSITLISKNRVIGRRKQQNPKDMLSKFPWKFHHRTQLVEVTDMEVVAKQEFYELSPKLPLISVMEGMTETPILRYGIIVKSLQPMIRFYECLLGRSPFYTDNGFCCFEIGIRQGVTVQFSLKKSPYIDAFETTNAIFVSRLQEEGRINPYQQQFSKIVLNLTDPDGNLIGIERNKNNDFDDYSDVASISSISSISCYSLMEDEDYSSSCDNDPSEDNFSISDDLTKTESFQYEDMLKEYFPQSKKNSLSSYNSGKARRRTDSGFDDPYDSEHNRENRCFLQRTDC